MTRCSFGCCGTAIVIPRMPQATKNPLNVVRSLVPILKLRDGTRDDKLSLRITEREGVGDNLKLTLS